MKVLYKVHSSGPRELDVKASLPDGQEIDAKAKLTVVELIPEAANQGGTVTLLLPPDGSRDAEFAVGATIEATFAPHAG